MRGWPLPTPASSNRGWPPGSMSVAEKRGSPSPWVYASRSLAHERPLPPARGGRGAGGVGGPVIGPRAAAAAGLAEVELASAADRQPPPSGDPHGVDGRLLRPGEGGLGEEGGHPRLKPPQSPAVAVGEPRARARDIGCAEPAGRRIRVHLDP